MKNLREILEKKTRKELAYLIGLGYYQHHIKLGYQMEQASIFRVAKGSFFGTGALKPIRKPEMIKDVLFRIERGDLRAEQI